MINGESSEDSVNFLRDDHRHVGSDEETLPFTPENKLPLQTVHVESERVVDECRCGLLDWKHIGVGALTHDGWFILTLNTHGAIPASGSYSEIKVSSK